MISSTFYHSEIADFDLHSSLEAFPITYVIDLYKAYSVPPCQ